MSERKAPEMSVVIATPDVYETIRITMRHLRNQTARDRLEVVIVAPSRGRLGLIEEELAEFASFRVVEIGALSSHAWANAAGVRGASAPLIVFAEDHCFPEPEWAEALIAAHRQPWAAVGPVVLNANPTSLVSWADFLMAYGPWSESEGGRTVEHLPGHNSSYKRDVLLGYDPGLEKWLEAESVLHWDLRARGEQLYLERRARIRHTNFEKISPWFQALFFLGRRFGAARARDWSPAKRVAYSLAWPLVPWVRLRRILRLLRRGGEVQKLVPRLIPVLLAGLGVRAVGEALGSLSGGGDVNRDLVPLEFHRDRYLKARHLPRAEEPREPSARG
jgi:GT2 family glycosyltransferase